MTGVLSFQPHLLRYAPEATAQNCHKLAEDLRLGLAWPEFLP